MADEAKIGKPWQDDELDAIVADYFDMLTSELAGRPDVQARHGAALMERVCAEGDGFGLEGQSVVGTRAGP